MYNPYQQNPYNPYFGQMNPYAQPMQPSVTPPPQYQPIQNQRQQMPQTELSPQNRPVTLGGRIINDPAEIMPSEIPMDGTPTLFLSQDYSKIYVKAWSADGTIKTFVYSPIEQSSAESPKAGETENNMYAMFMDRFDKLEQMINRSSQKPNKGRNNEKENQNG